VVATEAVAAPANVQHGEISGLGVDAFHLGVRTSATSTDRGTAARNRAHRRRAADRSSSLPGVYRARGTRSGRRAGSSRAGATRIVATDMCHDHEPRCGSCSAHRTYIRRRGKTLPDNSGLVQLAAAAASWCGICEVTGSGQNGLVLEAIEGEIAKQHHHGFGRRGDLLARRPRPRDRAQYHSRRRQQRHLGVAHRCRRDGTMVVENRIEDISARLAARQNGNAINIFRAGNVIVKATASATRRSRGSAANAHPT